MPKSGRSTGLNRGNEELRFQTVSAAVVDALVLADLEGNIISWNSAAESIFGYAKAEVLGHPVMTPIPERYWTAHQEGLARLPGGGQSALLGRSTEMVAVKRNGVEIPVEISIGARGGRKRFFCAIIRDISERKALEGALNNALRTDALTGLGNRLLPSEAMAVASAKAASDGTMTAVAVLDLDGFKAVNDRFGHLRGDGVLCAVAKRLRMALRGQDVIVRFGGDEFSILIEALRDEQDAESQVERILFSMRAPFRVEGQLVTIGVSLGLAIHSGHFHPIEMLRHADDALLEAKRGGKARYVIAETQTGDRRPASGIQ